MSQKSNDLTNPLQKNHCRQNPENTLDVKTKVEGEKKSVIQLMGKAKSSCIYQIFHQYLSPIIATVF